MTCPHAHGMVPVDAGTILHIFRYLHPEQRPIFRKLADWPQLFFKCHDCGANSQHDLSAYDFLTWDEALTWAKEA